jgi:hypothetical protein
MNLAEHFFQEPYAFVSFKELGAWSDKHALGPQGKRELLECLLDSGGKQGHIQWKGGEKQKAIIGFGLFDFSLWSDRMSWGKGVTITYGE